MRLPQTVFLACATAALFATVWYMATFASIDSTKWNLPSKFNQNKSLETTTAVTTYCEELVIRLRQTVREKNHDLEDKDNVIKQKDDKLKESEQRIQDKENEIKKIHEDQLQKEKDERRKKEEDEKKKIAEEEKKKADEEKKEEDRRVLTDAYYVIRDKMLLEEHKLMEPVEIPDEERGVSFDSNGRLLPNGKQILLLSASDGGGSTKNNLTELLMSNRQEYADYHGYTHLFLNTTKYKKEDGLGRSAVWFKLPAIKEAFEKHPEAEWIWWVDTDIIIMNENIDLAKHLLNRYVLSQRLTYGRPVNDLGDHFTGSLYPTKEHVDIDNIDIIFTQDKLGINAGSFFIKRSFFAEFILDMWGDPFLIQKKFSREEQDAFIYLFTNHKTVFRHTGLVPQRMINAYHNYYLHTADWKEGDLAIHFAGHNKGKDFERNFVKYWRARQRVPKKYQIEVQEPELFKEVDEEKKKEKEEEEKKKVEEEKKKEEKKEEEEKKGENK